MKNEGSTYWIKQD